MKLLYCKRCGDVLRLQLHDRKCECGACGGVYTCYVEATYWGDAIPIGFNNTAFHDALDNQPENGLGRMFGAFVIPKECERFTKIDE